MERLGDAFACRIGDSSVRTPNLLPCTFHQRSKLSPGLLNLTLLAGLLTLGEPIDRTQAHSQGAQFLAVHPDDHDHITVLHFDSLRNFHANAVRHVSPLAFKLGAAMPPVTDKSLHATQLPILLLRQVHVLAAPAPRPNAVIESGEGRIFGLATHHESAKVIQGREVVEARPGADAGAAVGLDEVDRPGVVVVLEVEQNPRRGSPA